MLTPISWPTYWSFILTVTIIYYLFVWLRFFRTSIGIGRQSQTTGLSPEGSADTLEATFVSDLMGKAEPELFLTGGELEFAPSEPDERIEQPPAEPEGTEQVEEQSAAAYAQMREEIDTLVSVIATGGEDKPNLLMLYGMLTQKFEALKGTSYQKQADAYLVVASSGKVSYEIAPEELEERW